MMSHRQETYRVRFDWGTQGAAALVTHRADVDVAVVVDVLSFTTTVSVALDAGTVVLPYPWDEETAPGYAREHDAVLAVARGQAGAGQISLSPGSIRATEAPARLVLPSPNGSTISYQLGSLAPVCLAACLRNAAAVTAWIGSHHMPATTTVAVIAAGERWPDGGLRPAAEDLWGAGAVIAGLAARGWTALSPEAELARAGYGVVRGRELDALLSCASGRELVGAGYRDDVAIAAEADLSAAVPLLVGQRFVAGG
jgi:2-phosphosulfolactate phosphatase